MLQKSSICPLYGAIMAKNLVSLSAKLASIKRIEAVGDQI